MTFTYDPTVTTDLGIVRRHIGDVDSEDPRFTDEEINGALAIESNLIQASILLIDWRIAEIATDVDRNAAGVSSSVSQEFEHWNQLRDKLNARANTKGIGVHFGGPSISRKETIESDSDFQDPAFKIGQHDAEGNGLDPDENG